MQNRHFHVWDILHPWGEVARNALSRLFAKPIAESLEARRLLTTTYYVNPITGNDNTGNGSSAAPFQSIQFALDTTSQAKGPTTIYLETGVYRVDGSDLPANEPDYGEYSWGLALFSNIDGTAAQHSAIEAAPGANVWLSGSSIYKGSWSATGTPNVYQTQYNPTSNLTLHPVPSQVFYNWSPTNNVPSLTQIGTSGSSSAYYGDAQRIINGVNGYTTLPAGSFWYNTANGLLYVNLGSGISPAANSIEISDVESIIHNDVAQYVDFNNLNFCHTDSYALDASGDHPDAVFLPPGASMNNCTVTYTDFAGLDFDSTTTGVTITNCTFSNNGQSGVQAAGNEFLITDCSFLSNNYRRFEVSTSGASGGIKVISNNPTPTGTIENCVSADNIHSAGIWLDTLSGFNPLVIADNYVHDNGGIGIDVEATENAQVFGNLVTNNGEDGIRLTAASHTSIYNNTLIGNNGNGAIEFTGEVRGVDAFSDADIGAVGAAGSSADSNGTFTVGGAGAGITGTADALNFASVPASGDQTLIADITSQSNTNGSAQAGVMIRNSLAASDVQASVLLTPSSGVLFEWRANSGGTTNATTVSGVSGAVWVKLIRIGNSFSGYYSTTGTAWTEIGVPETVLMGTTTNSGLAVSSDAAGVVSNATFTNVDVTGDKTFTDADIGSVGAVGSGDYSSGAYTVSGSGADISGTADALNFISVPAGGNQTLIADVAGQTNTNGSAKAGVMIRNSLSASDLQASVVLTPSNGVEFEWRANAGGPSNSTTISGISGPTWVELVRSGNSFSGYYSSNGASWIQIGSAQPIAMNTNIFAGLAVSSHVAGVISTAAFTNVSITGDRPYSDADVGPVGAAGSSVYSNGTYTLSGSGADISGAADAFNFLSVPAGGNQTLIADVTGQTNTNGYAKAGVMIRNSLSPADVQASIVLTPANGVLFEWRSAVGGPSNSATASGISGPTWVELVRSGNSFSGYYSTNGSSWTQVGSSEVIAMGSTTFSGMAVTSHDAGALSTATFTNVAVTTGGQSLINFSTADDVIVNNIIANNNTTFDVVVSTSGTGNILNDNLYYRRGGPIQMSVGGLYEGNWGATDTNPLQWQSITGQDLSSNIADPMLVNTGGTGEYQPGSNSPARSAGINLYAYADVSYNGLPDFNGTARPTSGNFDIGAFQAASMAGTAGPVIVNNDPTVWVDDTLPSQAVPTAPQSSYPNREDLWAWGTLSQTTSSAPISPASGVLYLDSGIQSGVHEQSFLVNNSANARTINANDILFAWVWIDAGNLPGEIMLQFNATGVDNTSGWAHRAFWGANNVSTDGSGGSFRALGSASLYQVSPSLPSSGQWHLLEVPAASLGLTGGSLLYGIRVTLDTGHAYLDRFGSGQSSAIVTTTTSVVGRYLFYEDSYFDNYSTTAGSADDSAIATDKSALLPGQTATFANYSSYSNGINGVMIDVANLADPNTLSAANFSFYVGNSSNIASWTPAPTPGISVRAGAGVGGSYRIELIWGNNAIQKEWLQVSLLAGTTGLTTSDVFYFGNAIGETGNNSGNAIVSASDVLLTQNNYTGFATAGITNPYDFNRDGKVSALDALMAQSNYSGFTPLVLITAPVQSGSSISLPAFTPALAASIPNSSLPNQQNVVPAMSSVVTRFVSPARSAAIATNTPRQEAVALGRHGHVLFFSKTPIKAGVDPNGDTDEFPVNLQ